MKKLLISLASLMLALVVASCDNNVPPTKAPGVADQSPQVDNPAPVAISPAHWRNDDLRRETFRVGKGAGAAWEVA